MSIQGTSKKSISQYQLKATPDKTLFVLDMPEKKERYLLSDIVPVLENLGFLVCHEAPMLQTGRKDNKRRLTQFVLKSKFPFYKESSLQSIEKLFCFAFEKILNQEIEQDAFNQLILAANLPWQDIKILRTYAHYLKQIHFNFEQSILVQALLKYPSITKQLVDYFKNKFDPKIKTRRLQKIEDQIVYDCYSVKTLADDLTIKKFLELMKASVRTNYFTKNFQENPNEALAIKLQSNLIQNMPEPVPLYETVVAHPNYFGIHLRNTKIARGGIRWSDRIEDVRTEILSLMKAQKVKNAVIVPSGAKGGFVLKQTHFINQEEKQKAGIAAYEAFIAQLLMLTDNIENNQIKRHPQIICYDDPDTYLVVAADKGTATFSDRANAISNRYQFWLGDAFASGGKYGYDHKKLGITARGAWESAKKHLNELSIDLSQTPVSVVGIGDMSGDVFGNGMLYSENIKLVAAFDHRHIFLDPNPDLKKTYAERKRLYYLPHSSWADFSKKMISSGGGVFSRQEKFILLSPEIKKVLQIQADQLTPSELIRAILMSPVDIIFNGGIGTYIKSSQELHAQVGDKTNDDCRINGNEVRARIVVEGGNLGATQAGRVEFALKGGLINADFIDNAAGVNCSDHEVNLKILFNVLMKEKKLTQEKRNQLLRRCENEITKLVLQDNIDQAWILSSAAHHAIRNFNLYHDYVKFLESKKIIHRLIDGLPSEKEFMDRKMHGYGLTRPELSVILAYTKIYLKEAILNSRLVYDADLEMYAKNAFPKKITELYPDALKKHPLLHAVIANEMSNQIINQMGLTYVYRLQMETGADIESIVKAQIISAHVFSAQKLRETIGKINYSIDMDMQQDILYQLRQLINLSTRWFLQGDRLNQPISKLISHYQSHLSLIEGKIPNLMGGMTREYLENIIKKFTAIGLPADVAKRIGAYRAVYTSLNIIEIATECHFDINQTAEMYFRVGEVFHLLWFRDELAQDFRDGHWNVLSRLSLRDLLDQAQKKLTILILRHSGKIKQKSLSAIQAWQDAHFSLCQRWQTIYQQVSVSGTKDYNLFFVAMHEFLKLLKN